MSATAPGARQRPKLGTALPGTDLLAAGVLPAMVAATSGPNSHTTGESSRVDLGDSTRVTLMLIPKGRGAFRHQAEEVLAAARRVLGQEPRPMKISSQTVFLRHPEDQAQCERLFAAHYGAELPVTNFLLQSPCCGAALALEAWAIGGASVRLEHFGPRALAVDYDGVRWVYCGGIQGVEGGGVYQQTRDALEQMRGALKRAGSGFEYVVRTWFYLGGITEPEGDSERYKELNRARTDFYRDVRFNCSLLHPNIPQGIYPASTGIGMRGTGLVASCMTLQTQRQDAFLLPLENPQQTPAYAYHPRYSPQSPKFSRAKALVLGHYATTWISGTASVVNAESRFPGDLEKQTEQTIDNIQRLISPENFAFHGVKGAGAGLRDLAKIRVYLKRPQDFLQCKAICERRFGPVPAIYAVADICRPELLVEIEGVAFSRYTQPVVQAGAPPAATGPSSP